MKSRLYRWADRWAVRMADRMGVTIARAKPLDLRGCDIHPLEAWYRAGRYQPVLMDVPLSKLRGLGSAAFRCTADSSHPFISTLIECESGKVRAYTGSALEQFYERWQPANAAEYFGFDKDSVSQRMLSLQPVEAVLPWDRYQPSDRKARYQDVDRRNWNHCGPVDLPFGDKEFERLVTAYSSIKERYVRRNPFDGDITGLLMIHGGSWFIYVKIGQHRVGVFSALGCTQIPIRLFFFCR
ncbi:hypothetical protein [Thioalkalivibrio paradoxus]|uniref:hypothetical protein n=1 Tax=Thioalkalivibrio paradoxus TaxID=108010 RepID=UPI00022C5BD2|nr:hypothetical protein [Thioalkalivibrio paradoxus]